MLPLDHAQHRILSLVQPLPSQTLPLASAVGRFLADPVTASQDLPPFDNSAMDGYALRAADVVAASPAAPVALTQVGQVAAGQVFTRELGPGECVRVFTGSPLPKGADAVIMQEDTRPNPDRPDQPLMLDGASPWENVRFRGEDVKQGSILMHAGERLTISKTALVAAIGCHQVAVRRPPLVGLIATGSELREPGEVLGPGQIFESNRVMLAALAAKAGAQAKIYRLVEDRLETTRSALAVALAECDAVVTSGGVSVGDMDFVKAAFQQLGGELNFWKVAIKPGKPFVLGSWSDKLLFGLPGNPVSAFVTFLLLVRPALLKMQGAKDTELAAHWGTLTEPLVNPGDRRHFIRVHLDRAGHAHSTGTQASHLLHSLAHANGLVDVPPNTTWPAGTAVQVLSWED